MAKASRDKGKRGELEVANLATAHGLPAYRTAQLQAGRVPGAADVAIESRPDLHIEVKRDERLSVDAMVRQAQTDAPEGSTWLVAYRRNGGGVADWKGVAPLPWLFGLLAELHELRAWAARVEATHPHLTSPESATTTTHREDR